MRKHGSNRPSIATMSGIAALLVVNLTNAAFAARGGSPTGSNSQQGSAVWLVDYDERGCTGGSVNTSDNYITDDYDAGFTAMHFWAKSRQGSLVPDNVVIEANGKQVDDSAAVSLGVTCGSSFALYDFYWENPTPGTYTVKVYDGAELVASDSARFD